MKKLMCAVVAAAGIAAISQADVESSNVVGYQNIPVRNGWNFFTVTFKDISQTSFKLSSIECTQTDGTHWNDSGSNSKRCSGNIKVMKISAAGTYGDGKGDETANKVEYLYYGNTAGDAAKMGWFVNSRKDDLSNKVGDDNEVLLANGEGVVIYCEKSGGILKVSGEVELASFPKTIGNGWTFGGNNTPVAIKLSEVGCTQLDGTRWNDSGSNSKRCSGNIKIMKISAAGTYGDGKGDLAANKVEYLYYGNTAGDAAKMGWFINSRKDDLSNKVGGDNEVTFEPGEGWVLYCEKSGAIITIPSPIKTAE